MIIHEINYILISEHINDCYWGEGKYTRLINHWSILIFMYILTANVIKSSFNRKSSPTEPGKKSSLFDQRTVEPSPNPDDKIVSPKPKKRRIYENSAPVYDNRQIYAADLLQTQLDYSGKGLAGGV